MKRRLPGAVIIGKIQQVPKDEVEKFNHTSRPQLVLDIGTHKVLGLVTRLHDSGIKVLASRFLAHPAGAMRDGQIHDVPAVASTLRQVVRDLEMAVNETFTEAHIAAAGRALRTSRGKATESHTHPLLFTEERNRYIEWEAVASAQTHLLDTLPAEEQGRGYYCIAHSRIGCWMDGLPMGSLVGQRGRDFTIEVLATFLPGAVVDSLEAVLTDAGLKMRSLTLEPIAALEAVIPPTMRHLDLTLVDVGAGTSDIAFTGGGTVHAFAMVPQAGDAITEAVSRAFLLDFSVAEQVKRAVALGDSVSSENILGEVVEIDPPKLLAEIQDATDTLANRIVDEIATWSAEIPEAVLLVGGGSRTPGLAQSLAARLALPPNRVVIRDRRAVRGASGEEQQLEGPDAVTALGIALRAARSEQMPPVRVRVNARPVCLFLPDRCTAREAARIAGMPVTNIVGRMGPGITVTVNGEVIVIPGTKGEPAQVRVNGVPADFDDKLANQDEVELMPPTPGLPPQVMVRDLVARWLAERSRSTGEGPFPRIRLEGEWQDMPVWVRRNGRRADGTEKVRDRDVYEVRFPQTVAEFLEAAGKSEPEAEIHIVFNGESKSIRTSAEVRRNGKAVALEDPISEGDRLDFSAVTTVPLYQILSHVGVSTEPNEGARRLTLYVRGEPAGFTTDVADGDEVVVRYE